MFLLPAIDILDGKSVRLAQGSYREVTVYNDDPVAQAYTFISQGAEWIHIVDLDGARTGEPCNQAIISHILSSVRADGMDVSIEVGGGVRSLSALEKLIDAGASRVVVGTRLARDRAFTDEAVRLFGDYLVAGVDARDGEAAVSGWEEGSGISAIQLIERLRDQGVRHLVYTDIAHDGMQIGIQAATYQDIAQVAVFPVVASGGIGSLQDIRDLVALGDDTVEGAILGRALYEGTFTLSQGLALVGGAVC
jgi:phosphoribosylformimino-5-aminoimidazole carboxamide ribotide isomerase